MNEVHGPSVQCGPSCAGFAGESPLNLWTEAAGDSMARGSSQGTGNEANGRAQGRAAPVRGRGGRGHARRAAHLTERVRAKAPTSTKVPDARPGCPGGKQPHTVVNAQWPRSQQRSWFTTWTETSGRTSGASLTRSLLGEQEI